MTTRRKASYILSCALALATAGCLAEPTAAEDASRANVQAAQLLRDPGAPTSSKLPVLPVEIEEVPDHVVPSDAKPPFGRPEALSASVLADRVAQLERQIDDSRAHLEIVATTTTDDGSTYDWIVPESQTEDGKLPQFPPLWEVLGKKKSEVITPDVLAARAEIDRRMKGPSGAVPLYRPNARHIAQYTASYAEFMERSIKPASTCVMVPGFGTQCRYWSSSSQAGSYWGTSGILSLWRPSVDQVNNATPMSLMQFAASATPPGGLKETIELGWQVQPAFYGDTNSHLFLFLTPDGYGSGSCYNQACTTTAPVAGWVALSTTITPGMTLTPSVFGSSVQEALIGVSPIPGWFGVWWLDQWIGAIPATFYDATGLASGITSVGWYGEIADNEHDGTATNSDMGSGQFAFPIPAWSRYAYVRDVNLQLRNPNGSLGNWQTFYTTWPASSETVTDVNCYNMARGFDPGNTFWNSWLIVGGPGRNSPNCLSDL